MNSDVLLNISIDDEKLKNIALNGSPLASAMALAVLDIKTGGKISELLEKIKRGEIGASRANGASKSGVCNGVVVLQV